MGIRYDKGLFTYYLITEGRGVFQMMTFHYKGGLADDYVIRGDISDHWWAYVLWSSADYFGYQSTAAL